MSLTLNLPQDLENELAAEAEHLGLPLSDYILRILTTAHAGVNAPRNGAELVAYWQEEGVIGARSDITDSQQHARQIRHQAERRTRP